MIVKKLAVPLINDKLLMQAEYCTIATAALSDEGFDLVASRLSTKCKVEIVTGLDVPTSPDVLKRILKHLPDRVALKIFTRTFFHANVYIFDLPFRKAVAFVGSGSLTLEGLKDHEELFYKITDPKEIEALKSWFVGYYEFAEPLTENIIHEYEAVYPSMKQREIATRKEKQDVMELTTRGFHWDSIKFKNQYFKKEDYLIFGHRQSHLNTAEILTERERVKDKLFELHELIKRHVAVLRLDVGANEERISSVSVNDHAEQKVSSLWIAYSNRDANKRTDSAKMNQRDFMSLQVGIRQREVNILLVPGNIQGGEIDRTYFRTNMNEVEYRVEFFRLLTTLGIGYWIEIVGEKRKVETFLNADVLWHFTKSDDWRYYTFCIGKTYAPNDPDISTEKIALTIEKEFDKLILLYRHLKAPE